MQRAWGPIPVLHVLKSLVEMYERKGGRSRGCLCAIYRKEFAYFLRRFKGGKA